MKSACGIRSKTTPPPPPPPLRHLLLLHPLATLAAAPLFFKFSTIQL
jgi:hypothetical protein